MNKLIELANGGLDISIQKYNFHDIWKITVSKDDDGITLRINGEGNDLSAIVEDVYEKWVKVTGRGAPRLALNILEHRKEPLTMNEELRRTLDLNDEIPF